MFGLELLAVETDEEGADIVEELVYPGEVDKALIDSLARN